MAKDKDKAPAAPKTAAQVLADLESKGLKAGFKEKTVDFYTSGNVAIDWALGGGFAAGKLVDVSGKSGSGKTTAIMQSFAVRQKEGGNVLWVDYERAFDRKYADNLGLDHESDSFVYLTPRSLEQGCDAVCDLIATGEFSMVAMDSIARMTTESELDGRMGDATVADKAKALYKFTRKVLNLLEDNECTLIVLNHLLESINIANPAAGSTKLTPGGNAVPYFASQRVETVRIQSQTASDSNVKYDSHDVQFLVTKNRLAPPFRKVVVRNEFGSGFNATRSVLEVARQIGIAESSGAWTYIRDPQLAQMLGEEKYNGWAKFVDAVDANPLALERLTKTALSVLRTGEIPE